MLLAADRQSVYRVKYIDRNFMAEGYLRVCKNDPTKNIMTITVARKVKEDLFGGAGLENSYSHLKSLLKQNMREVAVMLAEDQPKEEKAKIRAEALIRDDNLIEAYEILQLECELLSERIKLIDFQKDCPSDLVTVVSTLMWASHRVDIPELQAIRKNSEPNTAKSLKKLR